MSQETEWVVVEQAKVNRPVKTKIKGVPTQVMLSPSDIPSWYRAIFDNDHDGQDFLVIELRYLSNHEPTTKLTVDGAELLIGRNSRRVYRLSVPSGHVSDPSAECYETVLTKTRKLFSSVANGVISVGNANALGNVFDPNSGAMNFALTSRSQC